MYYIYIVASLDRSVLYTGFTSNLTKRLYEHRQGLVDGFSKKYKTVYCVYYESGEEYEGVLAREKQIKKWSRVKKERLIKSINPQFRDLTSEIHE